MKIKRRKAGVINIGGVFIGGNHPVAIQSMAKVKTSETGLAISQIRQLEKSGCEIVRVAVKDASDAKAIKKIKQGISLPLVADIHFDWRLALEAINSGADKIRLNPGNIYKKEQVRQVAREAKLAHIPIRVGLNSGSLPASSIQHPASKSVSALMTKAALGYIRILEKAGFYDIVVSLKASGIFDTIDAYRRMAKLCDYPLHLGVTATGPSYSGAIKSTVALSILLSEGIGDTIRVSLTDKPEEEIKVARYILSSLGLRHFGPEIISCPTCGRCSVDLVKIVNNLENKLSTKNYQLRTRPLKVAVMGCIVNGPGEAKEADAGVAFGSKDGLLFKQGKPLRKVSYKDCVDELLRQLQGLSRKD